MFGLVKNEQYKFIKVFVLIYIPDAAQFYLEDINSDLYIETKAVYATDNEYISELYDALGKKTKYETNPITGLSTKLEKASGEITCWEYNEKDQIKKVITNGKEIQYFYDENGMISTIQSGKKKYQCMYDEFLNPSMISINSYVLSKNSYNNNNGKLLKSVYGNGDTISYDYDVFNRISKFKKGNQIFEYQYNNLGYISKILSNNDIVDYIYDYANRLSELKSGKYKLNFTYDKNSNVIKKKVFLDKKVFDNVYKYNSDDNLVKIKFKENEINYIYDYLGRISEKNINQNLSNKYTYVSNGNKTSLIVSTFSIGQDTFKYIYDDSYNITRIYLNGEILNEYSYDANNQLISEIDYKTERKYFYTYNEEFNLVKKQIYTLYDSMIDEIVYEYSNSDWEDQLTKIGENDITYDVIGNPVSIGSKELSWINGRELVSIVDNENNIKYEYDINGIRTKKIVNGSTTNFYLDGNDVIIETRDQDVLYYLRDNMGELIGFMINDNTYYYQKNFQGDITGIYNDTYQLIAKYEYDAWGNILNIQNGVGQAILDKNHIAYINPFRYRGYYYDEETGFYYINNRYYSPLLCRFLNIDSNTYRSISSKNLYLYCDNNPVNSKDVDGNFGLFLLVCAAVGATVSVCATVVSNAVQKKKTTVSEAVSSGINGAIQGGTAVSRSKTIRTVGVFAGNFVQNTIDEIQSYVQEDKKVTIANALDSLGNIVVKTSVTSLESIFINSKITEYLGFGTNPGWFQPTNFSSCFTGAYANKFQQETIAGAIVDFLKDNWKTISEYILIM